MFSVPVCKFVPDDGIKPGSQVLDRLSNTIAGRELEEDILQNILCVALIPYPPADEIEQAKPLSFDGPVNRYRLLYVFWP